MKYFHLLVFCMMLIFTALQWNDVDAGIWIVIYSVTAILAFISYKKICRPCTVLWAILVGIFAIYMLIGTAPGLSDLVSRNAYSEIFFAMDDNKPYIEQTREALGLFIILTYCLCVLIFQVKNVTEK